MSVPLVVVHVDASVQTKNDSFGIKQGLLLLVPTPRRKGDAPFSVDDTVPRKISAAGPHLQDSHHLSGRSRIPGDRRNLTIGSDLPKWNALNDNRDLLRQGHLDGCHPVILRSECRKRNQVGMFG